MLLVKMLSIFNKRIFKRKGPKLCTLAIHCAIVAPKKNCLTRWCLCASFFRLHVTLACAWAPCVTHTYSDPTMTCLYIALLSSHFGPRCIVMDLVEMTLLPHPSTPVFTPILTVVVRSASYLSLVPRLTIRWSSVGWRKSANCIFEFLKGDTWLCAGGVHWKWQIYKPLTCMSLWICYIQTKIRHGT